MALKAQKVGQGEPYKPKESRKKQIFLLFVLVMIFTGFTLTAFIQPSYNGRASSSDESESKPLVLGSKVSISQAEVLEIYDGKYSVMGEVNPLIKLEQRIGGDFLILDESLAILNTGADLEDIQGYRDEDKTIIFIRAKCKAKDEMDCLVGANHAVGDTLAMEVYDLEGPSVRLKTQKLGIILPGDLIEEPEVDELDEADEAEEWQEGPGDNTTDNATGTPGENESSPFQSWDNTTL